MGIDEGNYYEDSSSEKKPGEHNVVWPTRPEVKEIYVPTAGSEEAEEYSSDINVLMTKYRKKVVGESDKDFATWTRSPTFIVFSVVMLLSLCTIFIIYCLIVNVKTIISAFVQVRDSVFGEVALDQNQFEALVSSKNVTVLLWTFVAFVLVFVHAKAIINISLGNKVALAWVRGVAIFWIFVALMLFFYLPLSSYDKSLYDFLSWGFMIIGLVLLGLTFIPSLRNWIRFS